MTTPVAGEDETVMENVRVLSTDGDRFSEASDIHVVDGMITKIEPTTVAHAAPAFAIPGLIDMHVHLTGDPHRLLAPCPPPLRPALMTVLAERHLRDSLRAGITSVRCLGSDHDTSLSLRWGWEAGIVSGARPFVSGPILTPPGGHGDWMGTQVADWADMEIAIRRNAKLGAQVVKFAMGSVARPALFDRQLLADGVSLARDLGMSSAIHANFDHEAMSRSMAARPTTIEHGYALTDATIEAALENGIRICPTLSALDTIVKNQDEWIVRGGRSFVDRVVREYDAARETLGRARQAGVRFVAGTDAGVPLVGHDSLPHELALMVDAGWTEAEALRAATSEAAAALGSQELGALRPGMIADVVLVGVDPLTDIEALGNVDAVYQGGILQADGPVGADMCRDKESPRA